MHNKIAQPSVNRMLCILHDGVGTDWISPIGNYLLYGYYPGGFVTSLLANDAMGMIRHSHPMNDIVQLKSLVTWIEHRLVEGTHYGSYKVVSDWVNLPHSSRRQSLENLGLIYDEQTEIMMILTA